MKKEREQPVFPNATDFSNDFDFMGAELLGEGAYGKVYKVYPRKETGFKDPGKPFAIKVIETFKFIIVLDKCSEETYLKALRELQFYSLANVHQNVIWIEKVYSWQETIPVKKFVLVFLMNLMDTNLKAEILRHSANGSTFSEQAITQIISQTLQVFEYLVRSKHFYHRDIKPENILLSSTLDVRVADFGVSKALLIEKTTPFISNTLVGTPMYLSPRLWEAFINGKQQSVQQSYEEITNIRHNLEKSDVYALGVTLLQMILLLNEEQLTRLRDADIIQQHLQNVHQSNVRQCLAGMLEWDEKKRFTWVQAISTFNVNLLPQVSVNEVELQRSLKPMSSMANKSYHQSTFKMHMQSTLDQAADRLIFWGDVMVTYNSESVHIYNNVVHSLDIKCKSLRHDSSSEAQGMCVVSNRVLVMTELGLYCVSLDGQFTLHNLGVESAECSVMYPLSESHSLVLIGFNNAETFIFDLSNGGPKLVRNVEGHSNPILAAMYPAQDSILLLSDRAGTLSARDLNHELSSTYLQCDYPITSLEHVHSNLYVAMGSQPEVLLIKLEKCKIPNKMSKCPRDHFVFNSQAISMTVIAQHILVISCLNEFSVYDTTEQKFILLLHDQPLSYRSMVPHQNTLVATNGFEIHTWLLEGLNPEPPKRSKGVCSCTGRCDIF